MVVVGIVVIIVVKVLVIAAVVVAVVHCSVFGSCKCVVMKVFKSE